MNKKISIDQKWFPLFLLGLFIISFGFYLNAQGFYFDDWTNLHYAISAEKAEQVYLFSFRPLHVYIDMITVSILGTSPLTYQILSLIARFSTVFIFWQVLKILWPNRKEETAWIAIIFMVYPIFIQQPISFAYRNHWTTYLFFMLSIFLMLKAYKDKSRFWLYTILSLLTMGTHLLIMEYFAMEEFLRPILLWILIGNIPKSAKEKINLVLKYSLPYLIALAAFFYWRIFIVSPVHEPNPLSFPIDFRENPLQALLKYGQNAINDLFQVFFHSWGDTIAKDTFNYQSPFNIFSWALALIIGVTLFFIMRKIKFTQSSEKSSNWHFQAIFLGLLSIILSFIPTWAAGKNLSVGNYSDRFGLAPMFGASIVVFAILSLLITNKTYLYAIISILVLLSINTQLQVSNQYRWEWAYQSRTFWQLYWRAPQIQPNTALITDGTISKNTNRFTASFALNTLYDNQTPYPDLDYWLYEIYYDRLNGNLPSILKEDYQFKYENFLINFESDINGGLLFRRAKFPESNKRCLWFLTEKDINNFALPDEMRQLSVISNINRILPDGDPPSPSIFGPEPDPTWCTYYQKSDLARQFEEWDKVIDLFIEAEENGFYPHNGYEYIPFIQAYAAADDWDTALNLTNIAFSEADGEELMLCATWHDFKAEYQGERFESAYTEVIEQFSCIP